MVAEDALARTVIRSPQNGIVMDRFQNAQCNDKN